MPITCVEDFRQLAKQRVPRMFYDYVDGGSWSEGTYKANRSDLQQISFRQRVGVDLSNRSLETKMVGQDVTMPVALAPTGLSGMQWADGEILAAKAAENAGVPFTLSTVSICSIEDIADNTSAPFWFQLYIMKDRNFVERLVARAAEARCSALVLTLDLQVQGQRHKDIKNGLSTPPKMNLRTIADMCAHPRWCATMLRTNRRTFGNIVGHAEGVGGMTSFASWVSEQFDLTVTWSDVKWIRRIWSGKLIVKGIMDADDALEAIACGADAVVVSNHGGRQLDGAPSSISALPRVAEAVGRRAETLFDGGILSGQDALRALALGAKGVFIGRAFNYGLAAQGEKGVSQVLSILRRELDLTMAFCGVTNVEKVDGSILELTG